MTAMEENKKLHALIDDILAQEKPDKSDSRIENAKNISALLTPRERTKLMNVLLQSLVEDEDSGSLYPSIKGQLYAGSEDYWNSRKEATTLAVLPVGLFQKDKEYYAAYLSDLLPADGDDEDSTAVKNIVQGLRSADYHMYMLTHFTQFFLRPYTIRNAISDLSGAIEELLCAVARRYSRVGNDPMFTEEELLLLREHQITYPLAINNGRKITFGSFLFPGARKLMREYKDKSLSDVLSGLDADVTPDLCAEALSGWISVRLPVFNKKLWEKGDALKDREDIPSSIQPYINKYLNNKGHYYRVWLEEMIRLRNQVHMSAVNGTIESAEEYQDLTKIEELYAFLYVTIEALKLLVNDQNE